MSIATSEEERDKKRALACSLEAAQLLCTGKLETAIQRLEMARYQVDLARVEMEGGDESAVNDW